MCGGFAPSTGSGTAGSTTGIKKTVIELVVVELVETTRRQKKRSFETSGPLLQPKKSLFLSEYQKTVCIRTQVMVSRL